jgi:hypothetical protein
MMTKQIEKKRKEQRKWQIEDGGLTQIHRSKNNDDDDGLINYLFSSIKTTTTRSNMPIIRHQ